MCVGFSLSLTVNRVDVLLHAEDEATVGTKPECLVIHGIIDFDQLSDICIGIVVEQFESRPKVLPAYTG